MISKSKQSSPNMSKIHEQRCLSSQFTPFAKNTNMNIKYEIWKYKTYVKEWKLLKTTKIVIIMSIGWNRIFDFDTNIE